MTAIMEQSLGVPADGKLEEGMVIVYVGKPLSDRTQCALIHSTTARRDRRIPSKPI